MTAFAYRARDRDGRFAAGVLEAPDPGAAARSLRGRGLLVLQIAAAPEAAARRDRPHRMGGGILPPGTRDVEIALNQLALLLDSGLTLLEAIEECAAQARRRSLGRVLQGVGRAVERGGSLFEAFEVEPRVFPPLVRELVRAGEESGTLESSLRRAADHLQRRREIRAQVAQALLYPSIVVALTVVVTSVMVTTVIPELEKFFAAGRARLPLVTRVLLDAADVLREIGPLISIGLVATFLGLLAVDRFPPGRRVLDRALFALPLLGNVRRLAATALFSRSLSVLLGSGIPIVRALETSERILHRPTAAGAITRSREAVIEGQSLASGLQGSPAFAPILPRMVAIGEKSGDMERVLLDAAEYHEGELRAWIRRASYVIEPVVTLVVGGIVGFVYVAFFIAIFSTAGGLS